MENLRDLEEIEMRELLAAYRRGDLPPLRRLAFLGREEHSPFIRGWTTLVAAAPKVGKSHLLAQLVLEWDDPVLYLTEESIETWAYRVDALSIAGTAITPGKRLKFSMGLGYRELIAAIAAAEEPVVILDTVKLLGLENENDNSEVSRLLTPAVTAARLDGKTLILVHHLNKPGAETKNFGRGIAGATAFLATVDVAASVYRDPYIPNRRVVQVVGRIDTPGEFEYDLVNGQLLLADDPVDDRGLRVRIARELLGAMESGVWYTTKVIKEMLPGRHGGTTIDRALRALAEEGEIERYPGIEIQNIAGKTPQWRLIDE